MAFSPRYQERINYWSSKPGHVATQITNLYKHLNSCNKSHTITAKLGQEKCTALNDSISIDAPGLN